jgi:hypothetical protein
LLLAGFDCQFHSEFSIKNLKTKTREVFTKIANSDEDIANAKIITENLHQTYYWTREIPDSLALEKGWAALNALLLNKNLINLSEEEKLLVENIKMSYDQFIDVLHKRLYQDYNYAKRDKQMFRNLLWLLTERFPNQKVILWAHNSHIAKNIYQFEHTETKGLMMGHLLGNKKLNPFTYYALGFTSFAADVVWANGQYATIAEKPKKNSFENWINPNWKYAFIDWKNWNKNNNTETFFMKGSLEAVQHKNYNYLWNKAYDGVFFLRNIDGCRRAETKDTTK